MVVSTVIRRRRDCDSQLGHRGRDNHLSEEDEVEQARVWFSHLLHALFARRSVLKEAVCYLQSNLWA